MKRFDCAVIIVFLCAGSFWWLFLVYRRAQIETNRRIDSAYERGVRWGERERKHFVVFEGVTNKYDTINEAMSNAVSGAAIYLAAGVHIVGPHGMLVPPLSNLMITGSLDSNLTDARGKRIGTTIEAAWSGVTNNAVEKKEP